MKKYIIKNLVKVLAQVLIKKNNPKKIIQKKNNPEKNNPEKIIQK